MKENMEEETTSQQTAKYAAEQNESPLERAKKEIEKKPVRRKYVRRNKDELTRQKLETQVKRSIGRPRKCDDSYYVTNEQLMAELVKWRESGETEDTRTISEDLGKYFLAIAGRLTNHSAWKNYNKSIRDEMTSYACFKMIQGLPNYNFQFTNPFAYFTQAAWNAFVTVIGKYYRYVNTKRKVFEDMVDRFDKDGTLFAKIVHNTYDGNQNSLDEDVPEEP